MEWKFNINELNCIHKDEHINLQNVKSPDDYLVCTKCRQHCGITLEKINGKERTDIMDFAIKKDLVGVWLFDGNKHHWTVIRKAAWGNCQNCHGSYDKRAPRSTDILCPKCNQGGTS